MFFRAYPRGKYAVLDATNPEYMKGCDVVIPVYIESEGVRCAVTTIRRFAFGGNALTKVVLPPALRELGPGCFTGDVGLREVVIPESLKDLGGSAFQDCKSLTLVTLPASVKKYGMVIFQGCTALNSVTISGILRPILCSNES